MEIASALRNIYPNDWQIDKYNRLLVNQSIFESVKRGDTANAVWNAANANNEGFAKRRALYLLYK